MYFTLRKNSFGILNISSEGICSFLQDILERHNIESVLCRSFCIADDSGKGIIVLNGKDDKAERIMSDSMNLLGIETAFTCAYEEAWGVAFAYKAALTARSPWFWCSLAVVAALESFVGLSGIFWLSFWGSAGWFSSRFILSRKVWSLISSWRSTGGKD